MKRKFLLFASVLTLSFYVTHVACAQWKQCPGPGGGSVSTLCAIGPIVFAGTSGGEFFRSTNSGASWNAMRLGASSSGGEGIAVSGSTIFAACDSFYVSHDSGVHWQTISALPGEGGPLVIVDSIVILGSFDGIIRSTDLGATWSPSGPEFVVSLLANDGMLYAGAYTSGLFQSNDTGMTWTKVDAGGILDGASIQSIAVAGTDIFVGGYYDQGFFRSTDHGATWDSSNRGMVNTTDVGQPCTIMSLYQDGKQLFAGTEEGIYVSNDSGVNWTSLSTSDAQALVRSGSNLLAATSSGILLSSDGGSSWSPSNSGLINTSVPALAVIGSHIFANISSSGVVRSDDSGTSWIAVKNGLTDPQVGQFVTIDTALYATTSSGIFESLDSGESWHKLGTKVLGPLTAIGSSLIGANSGFFLSRDGGVSWTKRSDGFNWGQLVCMLGKGTEVYAGNSFGDCGTVYRSTDSGSTWLNLDLKAGCTDVYCLASDSQYVFAGTGPGFNDAGTGLFRRSDVDTSWTQVNSGLPDMTQIAITTIATSDANVFFGTGSLGVFCSTDFGASWKSANEGLTNLAVQQLVIAPPYIFAGIGGAGVWRRPLLEMISQSVASNLATVGHAITTYPNPFSKSTKISFTSETGYATVSIVNLLGQEVARIFSGELAAGEHAFTWDAHTVPQGIYECLTQTNGHIESAPMIVVR